jgi:sterol desaturase/sphingolipid hydroxylase (fatty acid hydroxylase superfamily)
MSDSTAEKEGFDKPVWNHHPELPVAHAPLFDWPPKPVSLLRWYAKSWISLSTSSCLVLLALTMWFWMQAPIARYQVFELSWLLENHICNLCLMILVAGGLHLYFYTFNKQGSNLKFDPRESDRNHERFTFNNQVLDNVFWTLVSGVTFWTAYEAAMLWAYANDTMPLLNWGDSPVWFVLLFPLLAMWHELHFYFVHRLLHWPPLYRIAHAVHHRNSDTGPWSGISMHPYEHFIYFTSLLIHLVLPTHPLHLLFHLYWVALAPAVSHSGYAGVLVKRQNRFATGSFFHQLHHRYFECNYATSSVPVDVWAGSFHDGTPQGDAYIRERRKRKRRSATERE